MKILQIGPVPPEVGGGSMGGVATHVWNLANQLVQRGHQVAILADNYRTKTEKPDIIRDVLVFGNTTSLRNLNIKNITNLAWWRNLYLVKKHFGRMNSWPKTALELSKYKEVIASYKPDVIHVHHLEKRFPLAFYLSKGKHPLITTVHSTSSVEFGDKKHIEVQKELIKKNLMHAQNLIFVSHYINKRFEELFPSYTENINTWVVYNPLDSAIFPLFTQEEARARIDADRQMPLILYVGSLIPSKGAKTLIEAVFRLKHTRDDIKIFIIGEGSQKPELETLISEYNLETTISLLGFKPQEELVNYYNAADLFVLPSVSESFGLVYFEAMLCGCPVIGSSEVLLEVLPSKEYGYYVPPGDPVSLSMTIDSALEETWDREHIRQYALTYEWKNCIAKYENIYMEAYHNKT